MEFKIRALDVAIGGMMFIPNFTIFASRRYLVSHGLQRKITEITVRRTSATRCVYINGKYKFPDARRIVLKN
jgi:hypothetical protein